MTTNFFSPLSFVAVFGSGIQDPGWLKIRIRDLGWTSRIRNCGISCLDSSLGRVPACDAGDPGSIPGGGKLNDTLLEDRDDPGQVSRYSWLVICLPLCCRIRVSYYVSAFRIGIRFRIITYLLTGVTWLLIFIGPGGSALKMLLASVASARNVASV